MKKRVTPAKRSELRAALGSAKAAFIGVGVFSGLINILMLTGALFMLEVYDRVLPSRSVPTLVALCVLAAVLFIFQALLDAVRGRLLVRIGGQVDGGAWSARLRRDDQAREIRTRRAAAGARSRRDPLVRFRRRPDGAVRSAVGAALSRDLLCVPFLDRHDGAHRRGRARRPDATERGAVARAGPGSGGGSGNAQPAGSSRAAAMPKRSSPWAWSSAFSPAGASSAGTISRSNRAPTTSPADLARQGARCARRSSRACLPSAPSWSSSRRRPAAS